MEGKLGGVKGVQKLLKHQRVNFEYLDELLYFYDPLGSGKGPLTLAHTPGTQFIDLKSRFLGDKGKMGYGMRRWGGYLFTFGSQVLSQKHQIRKILRRVPFFLTLAKDKEIGI